MLYPLGLAGLSTPLISKSQTLVTSGRLLFAAVAIIIFGYRYLLSKAFTDVLDRWLKEDLADIASHYRMVPVQDGSDDLVPSSESGFWVAEYAVPGRNVTEIVGCLSLGAFTV
ncbi:hypothetical protein H0H92_010673 [Tricholoma furcatifolium]|nr:hypothetical protein H0H92_010673 [Tricholoma furcatifolium]